jgi:hypothetical protein
MMRHDMDDGVLPTSSGDLKEVVQSAVAEDGLASAVIFVVSPGSSDLALMAAAGVAGPALKKLTAEVRDPAHPIRTTLDDDGPTFDVRPVNPGGPALRSHLPLVASRDGRRVVVGVLAVAHEEGLSANIRKRLVRRADAAAEAIQSTQRPSADKGADK